MPAPVRSRFAIAVALALAAAALPAGTGCATAKKKSEFGAASSMLRDERISRRELEGMSNDFADKYFNYILDASEAVMQGNEDLQQRRVMNGMRLLAVSSMYDIATSPDTLMQLVNQMVVVTLQNYYWVDSGRAKWMWGDRSQRLVENLRRAREDIWSIASKVFTDEQLEELDLLIATWWSRRGGTEFVAYVRFSEVAAAKGSEIIEAVQGGGGLLEPLDRVTDVAEDTRLSVERTFFWAKRVPLFATWQADALMYDVIATREVGAALDNVNSFARTADALPERFDRIIQQVEKVQSRAGSVVEMAFWRALVVLGVVFAGVFVLIWWKGKNR